MKNISIFFLVLFICFAARPRFVSFAILDVRYFWRMQFIASEGTQPTFRSLNF